MAKLKLRLPPSGFSPHPTAMASRRVDFPEPFSPIRKVTFGWNGKASARGPLEGCKESGWRQGYGREAIPNAGGKAQECSFASAPPTILAQLIALWDFFNYSTANPDLRQTCETFSERFSPRTGSIIRFVSVRPTPGHPISCSQACTFPRYCNIRRSQVQVSRIEKRTAQFAPKLARTSGDSRPEVEELVGVRWSPAFRRLGRQSRRIGEFNNSDHDLRLRMGSGAGGSQDSNEYNVQVNLAGFPPAYLLVPKRSLGTRSVFSHFSKVAIAAQQSASESCGFPPRFFVASITWSA